MNERIKDFVEEAGFHPAHPMSGLNPNSVFPPTNMNGECSKELKKFAELIIQECANIVNSLEQHEGQGDCSTAEYIKEHFGV